MVLPVIRIAGRLKEVGFERQRADHRDPNPRRMQFLPKGVGEPSRANFDAAYTEVSGNARFPATDAMLTI